MRRVAPLLALVIVTALAIPSLASPRGGTVHIAEIAVDPPGADNGSNPSLNKEAVVIVNDGTDWVTMTGWTLQDRDGHVFRFPTFTLWAEGRVTIHNGRGRDNAKNLYWDSDGYVWDNDGDGATLRRGSGSLIDHCAYSGSGSVATC
jgi:Lamin Tail Domain